jgi:hypothetical protein
MPILSVLDNFATAGSSEAANRIAIVQGRFEYWLTDTSYSQAGEGLVYAAVHAKEVMRGQVLAPIGATLKTATAIGVYDKAWSSSIELLTRSYDFLESTADWVQEQVSSFIKGLIGDLMDVLSPALKAVFDSLGAVSSALRGIPMVGALISGAVESFRAWRGILKSIAKGKKGKGSCPVFDWGAEEFVAADALNASDRYGRIGSDVTSLFMPPEMSSYEVRTMNIANPNGSHYESSQSSGMHGYAPGVGAVAAFSTRLPYLGMEPGSDQQDALTRYNLVKSWFQNGRTIKPWVPYRQHPNSPKTRWNAEPLFRSPYAGGAEYCAVPIDPFPKTTGMCSYAYQQCTGTGPQALMADWNQIDSEWLKYTVKTNYGTEPRQSLPDCEGYIFSGRLGSFSTNFDNMAASQRSIFMYEREALIMKSALSFYSGEGIIPDPKNMFFEWMKNIVSSSRWKSEVEATSSFGDPLVRPDRYGGWEAPLSTHSLYWYVKYVCESLRSRQLALASTDAAAYVSFGQLGTNKVLRAKVADSRQRILAGGGMGIDMAMAFNADEVFAKEIESRKGKTIWESARAEPPELPFPEIRPPTDWSPSPQPGSGKSSSSAAPLLMLGGLAAAAFLLKGK